MSRETVQELIVRLSADSRPYNQGIQQGTERTQKFEAGVKQTAKGIALAFTGVAVGALKGFVGWLGRGVAGLGEFTARGVLTTAQGLDALAESTRDANGELSGLGKVGKVAAGGLEIAGKAALTASRLAGAAKAAVVTAAVATAVASGRAAAEVTPDWNRVRTILGDTANEYGWLRDEVTRLSADMGVEGPKGIETFYEVLSAMPELVKEPVKALDILRIALEDSIADPKTDPSTAARAITGILNAYNLGADQAREVSDKLFAAQDAGVTTFGEIADSFGNVGSMAASLGVRYEELLAIMAATTGTGVSTAESFTQIRGVLQAIQKPTADAVAAAREHRIEFTQQALAAKGLIPFLQEIISKTQGQEGEMARFFGSVEANSLLLFMTQNGDQVRSNMESFGEAAGKTAENVDIMNQSAVRAEQQLDQEMRQTLREVGPAFEGVGQSARRMGRTIVDAVNDAIGAFKGLLRSAREWTLSPEGQTWLSRNSMGNRDWRGGGAEYAEELSRPDRPRFQGANTPGMVESNRLSGDRPRFFGAGTPEPATVEYAEQKVRDFAASLEAATVAEYQRTNNYDEYQRRARADAGRVRDLALTEAERLRRAGRPDNVVNTFLAGALPAPSAPLKDNGDRERREAQSLADLAADARREAELLAAVWSGPLQTAPAEVRSQVEGLVRLERDIRDATRERNEARDRHNDVSGLDARIAGMQAQRAEGEKLLRILGPLRAAYDAEMRRINTQKALGTISDQDAAAAGTRAGITFNAGVANAIRSAEATGELTESLQRSLNAAVVAVQVDAPSLANRVRESLTSMSKGREGSRTPLGDLAGAVTMDSLREVRAAVHAVADAEREVTLAQGDPARQRAAELQRDAARENMRVIVRSAIDAAEATGLTDKQMTAFLASVEDGLGSVGSGFDALTVKVVTLSEKADGVAGLAGALAGVASSFGNAEQEAVDFLNSVSDVAAAYGEMKRAQEQYETARRSADGAGILDSLSLLSGYVGAAAAAIGLVRSLFGGEGDQERDQVLEENNDELRQLRLELRDFRMTGSVTANARDAVSSLAARESEIKRLGFGLTPAGREAEERRQMERMLAEFGMSFDELLSIAESRNIQLFDDKGLLIVGALDQLAEALSLTARKIVRYRGTLEESRRYEDLSDNLRNEDDTPTNSAAEALAELQTRASGLFERFGLGNYDVSTEEGRRGLEQALLAIVDAWRNNLLTAEDLNGLEGVDELLGIIEALAGSMDELREEVDSVAASFVNLPQGRKLFDPNAVQYDATQAVQAMIDQITATTEGFWAAMQPLMSPPPPAPGAFAGSAAAAGAVGGGSAALASLSVALPPVEVNVTTPAQATSELRAVQRQMWRDAASQLERTGNPQAQALAPIFRILGS